MIEQDWPVACPTQSCWPFFKARNDRLTDERLKDYKIKTTIDV